MADLTALAAYIARQRADLEKTIDETSSRSGETDELIQKLAELRRRAEETATKYPPLAKGPIAGPAGTRESE